MVQVLDVKMAECKQMMKHKKIIAFGAGSFFRRFSLLHPEIRFVGIVDNYAYANSEMLEINDMRIPVWPPGKLLQMDMKNVLIIVTVLKLEEIIDQLDQIEALNEVSCFFAAALIEYSGVNQKLRDKLICQIQHLANRTYESVLYEKYAFANETSLMKKYQIWRYIDAANTAASKARIDIKKIAGNLGYEVMNVHACNGKVGTEIRMCSDCLVRDDWCRCFERIPDNSLVIVQSWPDSILFLENYFLQVKKEKNIRFIYMIHDIEPIRRVYADELQIDEIVLMKKISDVFIVHNTKMKKYLVEQGVNESKIIPLHIFDYLCTEKTYIRKQFNKSITIAGNLDLKKSTYLTQLKELKNIKVHLYGPNFSEEVQKNCDFIAYHGIFPAEELTHVLKVGFGLVWDGDSIDTCSGTTGQYLRYNNPHKLSLYLAAGLPVIIWSEAAEADFVRENHVGITIDSLCDLEDIFLNISDADYISYVKNAERIAKHLRNGEYTRNAIEIAERLLTSLQ